MQILLLHHPFDKDIGASTIIQCTGHIVLDVYSKGQKSLLQNSSIDERRCSKVPQMSYGMVSALNCILTFHIHLRHFWASALINTWNFEVNSFGPCYTHLIQCVQCIVWWYWPRYPCQMGDARAKSAFITIVSISESISLGCNANSFDPWSRHIGLPSDPRIGDFNSWNFCYAWINICTMIHQKSGHTHDADTILKFWFQILNLHSKTGPGNI